MELEIGEDGVWIHLSTRPPVHVMHAPTARRLLEHEGGRIIPDPRLKEKEVEERHPVQEAPKTTVHPPAKHVEKGR